MPRMSGNDALMAILEAHDVEYVFGNPGSTEVVFMDALYDRPNMKYILTLHETVAAGMAEGYAWASGKTGFVNVHTLPGVANMLSTLYNANLGDMNMVVTAGQQDTRLIQKDPGLTGDMVSMTRPFTKWSVEVQHAADIPLVMNRAFKMAAQQPQGPVFVSLPQDVLMQEDEIEVGRPSWVPSMTEPDKEAIDRAADLLAGADSPALFLGFRLARCGALEETVRLAELIGARVTENYIRAETSFPSAHPLFDGGMATDLASSPGTIEDVDVMLVVGANFVSQLFHLPEPVISPKTKIVHLDTDPWEIGKNQSTDVGVLGDIKVSLRELFNAVDSRMTPAARSAASERAKAIGDVNRKRREVLWERSQENWDQEPIALNRLALDLRETLLPDTIIVDGAVTSSVALRNYLDLDDPTAYLAFQDNDGSLGDSLPRAIGVKLARPDRPVVGLVGDGNAMYSIQGLWTAAHHDIPVVLVIFNNATYKILKVNAMRVMGPEVKPRLHSMDLFDPPIDFARLAQDFGMHGEQVRSPKDLKPALERAINLGKPALVDVVIEENL